MAFFKALLETPAPTPAPAPAPVSAPLSPHTLHGAAQGGDLNAVKRFLGDLKAERRASLLGADSTTPLLDAAEPISPTLTAEDKKRIVNTPDAHNKTPLHYAAQGGYANVIEYLLGAGADRTIQDSNHETALDIAKRNFAPSHRAVLLLTFGLAFEAAGAPAPDSH